MAYPAATAEQVASYEEHGFLVVEHAIDPDDLADLERGCAEIVANKETLACVGTVTFHHSKTPHMTSANTTDDWRRILTQHLRAVDAPGEGDHYPWKVYVNQFSGERIKPATR